MPSTSVTLAEQHQFSKKQSLEMMEELVGMITKHLKKGERVKIVRNSASAQSCCPHGPQPGDG